MNKKSNMKKGITLIEIILAIVLIAIILGITIPKLMANSARAEIKAVISSDVKSIVEAATLWRKSSSIAKGSYVRLSSDKLNTRLPNTMEVITSSQLIMSSGLKTGSADAVDKTGVRYVVLWSFGTPVATTPVGRFAIGMDIDKAITDLQWDSKLRAYAREIFTDIVAEVSDGGTAYGSDIVPTDGFTPASGAAATAGTANGDSFTLPCSTTDSDKAVCYDQILISQ